ncbi:hypothetical protein AGOR_G00034260 [Albula goreensis]|uniref:DNA helicase n=1 Tax=Albula goreensis TaxID=1534307 RepID=A0A8T3DYI8_9TELE|nr:hypothetical protein AGOR_G00034260 [Albula goreensis]
MYPNMSGERQGQPYVGGGNWGPTQGPTPAGPQGLPQQPMAQYTGGVGPDYSLQNCPRTGPFHQEGGPALPANANNYVGHMGGPQQGPGMAAPPMRHPGHPLRHPAPGHNVQPESMALGRCFSPSSTSSLPHPQHHPHTQQQGMGFSPQRQPVPQYSTNGAGRFPSPYPTPNGAGVGPNGAPGMRVQGYPNAGGFMGGPVPQQPQHHLHHQQQQPHQQPQMGPQSLGHGHNPNQPPKAPPPSQMPYGSAPPMSPMKAAGVGLPPPQQSAPSGVGMGTGVETGGYPLHHPQGAGGISQPQQQHPLPPQSYGGLPLGGHGPQNPPQRGQATPFHQPQPLPHAPPSGLQHAAPPLTTTPPHRQPWTQPRPLLPASHKVPVTQSPSLESSEGPSSDLGPPMDISIRQLTSDPGKGDPKPKKKKQKKKKEKPEEEEEKREEGGPDMAKEPKDEVSSPGTPKELKEKKVKSTSPKAPSSKKPSVKKKNTETGAVAESEAKRKRESSDHSDVEERIPPASPEDEEDDTGMQKRRSSRQVKRKRYTEDLELQISDDEGDRKESSRRASEPQVVEVDGPIVEKIMAVRTGKKDMESGEEVEVEEFYVKFKNFSYLHCRWADIEELEKDKRIHQKVKRYKAKRMHDNFLAEMDDEPFNPDYVEVDRILEVSESTDENGEPVTHYLVKWCSLPYEDSTWELKADVDQGKIQEFERLAAREPELERVARPPADDWQESKCSREYKNGNSLREYQLEGVNWLLFNWYNTRNCILADEMGLGKTVQSITFLYEIFSKGIRGPFLVIAPLSTIPNWEREFRTWTDMNVVVYHGSQASRRTIQAYEMNFRDAQGAVIKGAYKFHAVITTFEMVLTDCPELRAVGWRCVVIDEAHRLKNRNCKLLEGLKMMDMEHKVLLTGTPLQNTVEELFSLLNFLEPERFPSEATFMQEFGDLKTEEQVQKLQAILKPMMLRRLKEDVEKNLAPKEETIIEVELTNVQKKYYRAILEKNFAFLSKGGGSGSGGGGNGNVPNLLNTMMELRKCCNHPYLINGAEEKILEEFREAHPSEGPELALQAMIQAAGKLVLIDKLLPKLKAGGHRVLIFSQMVRCLDILEDYLIQRRYSYERIDGRVRGNLRQAAIDRFSRPDSDRFVFLLCTRAGGLGINLTAADTCVIFDSDWNPQNDLQAQARCHRIGQSKAVKIYRLITRNSYEREMFDKASLKLGLDKAVLQSMSSRENVANGVQQLSKKEIEDLLRKGAYGALMEAEDEGSKFCEEDIDQILERRTQTITIECEGKGSTFAKASFVSSGNRTDISLEDPDFWQKWAKKAELDVNAINRRNTLVIDTPRVRKQTRHFSAAKEDDLLELSELESDSEDPPTPSSRPRPGPRTAPRAIPVVHASEWRRTCWCMAGVVGVTSCPTGGSSGRCLCGTWRTATPVTWSTTPGCRLQCRGGVRVKRGSSGAQPCLQQADWLASCNPDVLLQEDSYKKHLKHHCNKVLLRVRMLYYLRQEVIGNQADKILEGVDSSEIDIWIPQPFLAEVPSDWWDKEADKSLLIGVFKHGYEKYNSMRADPTLCFLEKAGMPDPKAVAAEQRGADLTADGADGGDLDREDEDPEYKPARMPFKEEMEDFTNSPLDVEEAVDGQSLGVKSSGNSEQGKLAWPSTSALTGRLRRLIAAYQRSRKREQQRQEALLMIQAQRQRPPQEVWAAAAKREAAIPERRHRWTRREEADFYRVVSTFGVLYDGQRFDWRHFRTFARLDRRTDKNLESYFLSFVAMCRRVCRLPPGPEEESLDPTLWVEPITEERASRTMYRIELLRRIREQVLPHPCLEERLQLCRPGPDLPPWWECGRHDHDLLVGASKHGLSRTDYHIFNDPELGFLEGHRKFTQAKNGLPPGQAQPAAPTPATTLKEEQAAADTAPEKMEEGEEEEVEEEKPETGSSNEEAMMEEKIRVKEEASSGETKPEGEEAEPKREHEGVELKAENEEVEPDSKPKLSEGDSKEGNEDKIEEEDISESSQAEASAASQDKAFDEESIASASTAALDETRDGFQADDAPMLNDRSLSFCHWPKDRVLIDRLDEVCDTVMKGKWPANRRQLLDFLSAPLPGYVSTATGSDSFAQLSAAGQAGHSHGGGSNHSEVGALSPQIPEDEAVVSGFPQEQHHRRRKAEGERAAKRRHLMEMVAQLREAHTHNGIPSPSAGPHVNGAFPEEDLPTKRRRGRRKNVEGLELLFANRKQEDSEMTKVFMDGVQTPSHSQRNIPSPARRNPKTQVTVGNLAHRNGPLGGGAPGNRNSSEWLGQHSTYAVDTTSYSPKNEELLFSPFNTPKQKRHRCRNPNKIDINALTGEERVPVVNRRSGRKMGGAMAPPIKDLARWLKENPEFAVSPDWTDIVKQSGFLPEAMFSGLLNGPVVREEGACRRGRRPKSEGAGVRVPAPAPAAPPQGLNPLLMSGLMGGLQSLQLAGLMGCPPTDPKQAAALLPLMLPGMFGLGGLLGNLANAAGSGSAPEAGAAPKKNAEEEKEEGDGEKEEEEGKTTSDKAKAEDEAAAAAVAASMSANPLAFNPFLLSAMAPGLFYPSMFLPPGLGGLSLPGLPQAALAGLQSAMAGALAENGAASTAGSATTSAAENETVSSTTADTGAPTENGVDSGAESSACVGTEAGTESNKGSSAVSSPGTSTDTSTGSRVAENGSSDCAEAGGDE